MADIKTQSFNPVTPSKLVQVCALAHLAGNNVIIQGPPGCGKSDIPHWEVGPAIEALTGEPCGVAWFPCAGMSSVDWRGLPKFQEDERRGTLTTWARPGVMPDKRDIAAGVIPKRGIVILDEYNHENGTNLAPLHQYLLRADFGTVMSPELWTFVLTGNRLQDGAMAQKTASSLYDRCMLTTLETSPRDWCAWAKRHGIRAELRSYIESVGPTDLFNFDPKREVNATPRSWAMMARQLDILDRFNAGSDILLRFAVGFLGEEIGNKFVAFQDQCAALVKIDEIERNPDGAKVPKDAGSMQFMSSYCAYRVNPKNVNQVVRYLRRFQSTEWLSFFLGEIRHIGGSRAEVNKFYKDNPIIAGLKKECEVDE